MADIVVKHEFVSQVPDGPNEGSVRPSDWNANHVVEGLGDLAGVTLEPHSYVYGDENGDPAQQVVTGFSRHVLTRNSVETWRTALEIYSSVEVDGLLAGKVDLGALSAVAVSNSYNDLDDLPTLGSAAATDASAYATAAQGAKADSAVQPGDLGDLAAKDTINNADWSGADLAIEHGGTGASSAAAARDNLGLGNVDNTSDADKPVSTAVQSALNAKADASSLGAHTGDTDNPHGVTAAQVGLGNVDNTSDADKPVSTAVQAALNTKANASSLGAHTGDTDNPHGVTKAQVGLGNVDNTSDADKPVSNAVQTALNGKASSAQGAKADTALQPTDIATTAQIRSGTAGRIVASDRLRIVNEPQNIPSGSGNFSLNLNNGLNAVVGNFTGNRTLLSFTNARVGDSGVIRFGTVGSYTLSFNAVWKLDGGDIDMEDGGKLVYDVEAVSSGTVAAGTLYYLEPGE